MLREIEADTSVEEALRGEFSLLYPILGFVGTVEPHKEHGHDEC
jgi:hypothetical protein